MKKYKYTAVNINKKKFTGTFLAEDEKDLTRELQKQNLYLVSCKVVGETAKPSFFSLSTGKVTKAELSLFCRQFAIMITAGLGITQTLEVLSTQPFDPYFRNIIRAIYEDVKAGTMLSDGLKKYNKVFPSFFNSMVRVGESSAKLDKIMVSLADYYEKEQATIKKTKGALAYPLMLLFLTIGIVVLMMAFVVPRFKDTLSKLDVEMPPLTKFISDASDYLIANYSEILLVVFAVVGVIFLFSRTEKGKYTFDTLAIKLPLIKKITIAKITSRFCRGFSLLLSSGMNIVEALDEIAGVLGNRNEEKRFRMAAESVKQGMSLTLAFKSYKLFPDILIEMIAVGERTATIDSVLMRCCDFFDEQAESATSAFVASINPIMLLIMGGTVGTLFIAIYQPILQIITDIG